MEPWTLVGTVIGLGLLAWLLRRLIPGPKPPPPAVPELEPLRFDLIPKTLPVRQGTAWDAYPPPPPPPPRPASIWPSGLPTMEDLAPHLAKVTARPSEATDRQLVAIARIGIAGDVTHLTSGQASAILSAKRYAEGVIHSLIRTMDGYPDEIRVEAALVRFIVSDDALRARANAWNSRSYARGGADVPRPKRDEHFDRVAGEARRLLRLR